MCRCILYGTNNDSDADVVMHEEDCMLDYNTLDEEVLLLTK